MAPPFRRTLAMRRVLEVLVQRPEEKHYGYDLSREARLRSGSMYPILARLERAGWLDSGWEDAAKAQSAGRPPRRYYRLTEHGTAEARRLLEAT